MLEVKETSPNKHLVYGHTSVGPTGPTQLTMVSGPCNRGTLVRAPGASESNANTDIVYVGDINVTTGNGFPLVPGAVVSVPVDDPSGIYLVTGATGPNSVAWMSI